MAGIICDDGANLSIIQSKKVAIIGYGSQGHAHALGLKDSGVNVVASLRPGSSSWERAKTAGLGVRDVPKAVKENDVVMILVLNQMQHFVYIEQIVPNLKPDAAPLFSHDFSVCYSYIVPEGGHDICTVTLKDPGYTVHRQFQDGRGVPALVCVEQGASGQTLALALSYAKGIGATRAGVIETTFTEETGTNLFDGQAVLCGGISRLIQYGYETLTEAGYMPKMAYFEVCHELKLIIDLINGGGLTKQRWSCSDTAEYGDYVSSPRVIGPRVKEAVKEILADIQDGTFTERFITDQDDGGLEFRALHAEGKSHPVEKIGQKLRKTFDWTSADTDYTNGSAAH